MSEVSTQRNMDQDMETMKDSAGNAKDAVKDLAGEARRYASNRMSEAKETAKQWAVAAKDKASDYGEMTADYIQRNPYKSIAFAAGAGILLGLLMKRR